MLTVTFAKMHEKYTYIRHTHTHTFYPPFSSFLFIYVPALKRMLSSPDDVTVGQLAQPPPPPPPSPPPPRRRCTGRPQPQCIISAIFCTKTFDMQFWGAAAAAAPSSAAAAAGRAGPCNQISTKPRNVLKSSKKWGKHVWPTTRVLLYLVGLCVCVCSLAEKKWTHKN